MRVALGELADAVMPSQRIVPKRALEAGYTFAHSEIRGALEACVRD